MARQRIQSVKSSLKASAFVLAMVAASQGMAAENGLQRYSPGVGGSDISSPLVPGWYFQAPLVVYHANKMKGGDGQQATSKITDSYRADVGIKADTQAVLPRLTYLDSTQFLGANVGWTAMLPLVHRKAVFTGTIQPGVPAGFQVPVTNNANSQTGSDIGIGDAEISPLLHWELGDHQTVTLAPTLVLPTGDYKATQRINAGYGNFFTFRPSMQYAFIGDGWDVGARGVWSFNTRNKDNGYYSGNMFNLDYQLMAFVSDDIRLGLQGYMVRQISADNQKLDGFSIAQITALGGPKEIINGNKASVNAAGPAVAWLKNGGEFLLEGKFLKEFSARNRTEGQAFWLTLSKPL